MRYVPAVSLLGVLVLAACSSSPASSGVDKITGKDGAVVVVPATAVERAVEKAVLVTDHEKVDAHNCTPVEARVGAHIECQIRTATSDGWATGEVASFSSTDPSTLVVAW